MAIGFAAFGFEDVSESMMKSMSCVFGVFFREGIGSIAKGAGTMSEEKTTGNGSWPKFPMWDPSDWDWANWDGNKEKATEKAKEFREQMQSFWERGIDMQKSALDNSKEQYDKLFASMQETKDNFAEFLPEDMPLMPPFFSSPKSFRESMKEWEGMLNDYFKEQADTLADFAIKSQEKACENMPEVPEATDKKEKAESAK